MIKINGFLVPKISIGMIAIANKKNRYEKKSCMEIISGYKILSLIDTTITNTTDNQQIIHFAMKVSKRFLNLARSYDVAHSRGRPDAEHQTDIRKIYTPNAIETYHCRVAQNIKTWGTCLRMMQPPS